MTRSHWLAQSALALALSAAPSGVLGQPSTGTADVRADASGADTDIIVTAQRREQTLLEVPQSISVVGGDLLEQQQANSFVDYAGLVPGLSLQQVSPGQVRVVLRGVNTGGASPTVAVYVDDTPFGASTSQSNGAGLAGDFDPFDIARVEVLKGPQGTFYGANALGGVLKFITQAPVLGSWEARGQAGVETVRTGGTGWSTNGVFNIPLGDTLAFRASGYYRDVPGYIDTVGRRVRDANDAKSYGGRASLLFQPGDALSVRLTAIAQNIRSDSRPSYDADPVSLEPLANDPFTGESLGGRLTRTEFFPERNDVDYRLYSGTLNWDFGFATLTSVTSYGTLKQRERSDVTFALPAGTTESIYGTFAGVTGALGLTFPSNISQKKFTQEVRLASPDGGPFEWLVGGYYTREKGGILQRYLPYRQENVELVNPALTLPFGPGGSDVTFPDFLLASLDSRYRESAGFGSVTWRLSSRFDITAGARYSHNEQSTVQVLDGSFLPLSSGGAVFGPETQTGRSSENVFTWSISPRLELGDRTAVYARVAKGYRPGGPNVVPPGAGSDFPAQFEADTLISYEAGIRSETADRTFGIDASLFYFDWRNIQVPVVFQTSIGPVNADGNGDRASSKGAEVTATLRPTRGLTAILNFAFTDATLKDDLPAGAGFAGDRLLYAPKWSGNASVDYEWDISDRSTAFVGGSLRLVSRQFTEFEQSTGANYLETFGRRLSIPAYETVDVRAGVTFDRFNLTLFARNLTDSRGFTNAGGFRTRPGTLINATPIRPRTIGATLGLSFR